jgi:hypothetical protein
LDKRHPYGVRSSAVISVSKITVAIAVLVLIAAVGVSGYEIGRNHSITPAAKGSASQFARAQAVADAEYVIEQAYQNSSPSKVSSSLIALNARDSVVGRGVALIRLGSDDRAYFQVRINDVAGDVCIDYGGMSYGETPSPCRKK